MRRLLPILFFVACSPPAGPMDGGMMGHPAPQVTSVSPAMGPVTGGTTVTVNGSNFQNGAAVVFGTTSAASVTFVSSTKLTALTGAAPAPGRASVTVINPDNQQATLGDAFDFQGAGGIAESIITNPAMAADTSGAISVMVTVTAQVNIPHVTDAMGQGMGVRAQVGFAPQGQSPGNWVDAAYSKDADPFDEYAGTVVLPGASGTSVTSYVLGARFSTDDGASWTLADRDGSANGFQQEQLPVFTVSPPTVDWCKLGGVATASPDVLSLHVGDPGPTIYAQVYKAGVTAMAGAGMGITGELGLGDASADAGTWAWMAATFNADQGNNDEYKAVLPTSGPVGTMKFAYRFNFNGGPYVYCDADSLTNGFSIDQCGTLTLKNTGVDQCKLQFPLSMTSVQGGNAGNVYGWVYAQTITEAAGAGPGIEGQLGYGMSGTLPGDASWTWTPASYHVEEPNGFEEWQAALTGPAPGSYAYAYRFRYDAGTWSYCDSDPSDGMIVASQLGALNARAFGPQIAACQVVSVDNFTVGSGDPLRVIARARTPGFSDDAGVTSGLRGQAGIGTKDDNASTSAAWGWAEASYAGKDLDAGADLFGVTVHPAYSGTRAVSFRFSVDDGGSWSYCDLNGSDVNGYEVSQQWNVTVLGPSNVDFCNLQFPPAMTVDAGSGGDVYGQIYLAGMGGHPYVGVTAEAGWGRKIEDPGASWTWIDAGYNGQMGNNDEYVARLKPPVGTWSYAWRFSQNHGATYCYGDLDGNGTSVTGMPGSFNGESGANENLGVVTVTP
jgi:hypothetical protein